jgi:hypothetical protein
MLHQPEHRDNEAEAVIRDLNRDGEQRDVIRETNEMLVSYGLG